VRDYSSLLISSVLKKIIKFLFAAGLISFDPLGMKNQPNCSNIPQQYHLAMWFKPFIGPSAYQLGSPFFICFEA
jgi:hypothetical protein